MSKKEYFDNFNKNYFDLLLFLKNHSNKNKEYNNFYTKNLLLKKTNIKYIIKSWYSYITVLYYDEIMNGDITFFLNKNFNDDKKKITDSYKNMFDNVIDFFKKKYTTLETDLLNIFLNYIKQITYYSHLYYKE